MPFVRQAVLCRHRALPGLGHAAACPAPRRPAERAGELALRKRLTILDAAAVGSNCCGIDVTFALPVPPNGRSPEIWSAAVPGWSAVWSGWSVWSGFGPGRRSARAAETRGCEVSSLAAVRPVTCPYRLPAPASGTWPYADHGAGPRMVRLLAVMVCCWSAVRFACRCGTDDPDEEFVAADEADRRPGGDDRADWPAGPALGHVGSQRRDDAKREQPAGQRGYREPVTRGIEVHHRAGIDQAVDRRRLQPGGGTGLAMRTHDGVGVPVRDIRRDACHGQDGDRGGHADRPVHPPSSRPARIQFPCQGLSRERSPSCLRSPHAAARPGPEPHNRGPESAQHAAERGIYGLVS